MVIDLPAGRDCAIERVPCTADGRRLSAPARATITGPAAAPEITSPSTFEVAEGTRAVATLTATDTDTGSADLEWSIPADAAGGSDRAQFTLTEAGALSFATAKDFEVPDDADNDGSYQVTVRVSDGAQADTAELTVTLTNVNEAPTANAGADQSEVEPGSLVTLDGSGEDPDASDSLTYLWSQTAGANVTLSDTAAPGPTFTAPDNLAEAEELTFTLRVSDAAGLTHEDSVSVTVLRSSPPLTASFENVPETHDGSTAETLRLRFSEDVSLSYRAFTNGLFSITNGTIGRGSRVTPGSSIAWDFPVTPAGRDDVVIDLPAGRACDAERAPCTADGRRLSAPVSATIAGPAAAPEITSASTFEVAEGTRAVATLTATDEDTSAADLTWSLGGGVDQAMFAVTTAGVLSFEAAKDFENPDDAGADGSYLVTVQVSDSVNTTTADLTVTLSNVNESPTADAGPDQTGVAEGATVTLSGSGTDPDAGDALTWAWSKTAGPAVTLADADKAVATFTAPTGLTADAAFTFTLKVSDVAGLYHDDTVTVVVAAGAANAAELSTKDIDADPENRQPRSLWGDGDTVWVADYFDSKLYAYDLADGSRAASRDIGTGVGNTRDGARLPTGVWGNGETIWVADGEFDRVYAFRLQERTRDAARDIATGGGRPAPIGALGRWRNAVGAGQGRQQGLRIRDERRLPRSDAGFPLVGRHPQLGSVVGRRRVLDGGLRRRDGVRVPRRVATG